MNDYLSLKFVDLGKLTATLNVANRMEADSAFHTFVMKSLTRHAVGDWGDTSDEDKKRNNEALLTDERLFSTYIYKPDQTKIWIITEADRSCTTVLFPEDY